MKDLLARLNNKYFESRVRLGIMSILMVEEWVHYSEIKASLSLTDGNLATHLRLLRTHELIEEKKEFVNRKPHTTYRVTEAGRTAFRDYLDALEELIKMNEGNGKMS